MTNGRIISLCIAGLLVLGVVSCRDRSLYSPEISAALAELDKVMLRQDSISAAKEACIDSLRSELRFAGDVRSMYRLCDTLYAEYEKWNVDSAFAYAYKKSELASRTGDALLSADAALDLANSYTLAGMYHDALASIDRVDEAAIKGTAIRHRYNYLRYDIYHSLLLDTHDARMVDEYRRKEAMYLDLCDRTVSGDVIEYYNTKANILIGSGHSQEAIALMESRLSHPALSIPDRAMLNYWIGKAYNAMGEKNDALYYYAVGARYDFLSPVKIYGSPISVTKMCFDAGDLERANRYIMRNYSDALLMGARYRINILSQLLPVVTRAYASKVELQNHQLIEVSAVLLVLLIAISITLFLLYRNRERLNQANFTLTLQAARLEESNNIKDAYLGQFLSMFSEHIDSLERYRSSLRITAKQMDFGAIQQELRSNSFIDAEWEILFDKFDETFLALFPIFPEQLNLLLIPEKRLEAPGRPGKLTNELRIFALIRLGVTDSKRIAMFLRLSLSTVYNYRVKLRNAALGDRSSFEDRVMKIESLLH